jgi:aminopeptidase N
MHRTLTLILLWLCILQVPAQQLHSVHKTHGCALHIQEGSEYENSLNEKWLSAYDVKHYHLTLEVSNTSTIIDGSVQVIAEATRKMDTLVLELHDRLVVSAVRFSNSIESPDYPAENVLAFEHVNNALFIELDRSRSVGEELRVIIYYGGDAGGSNGFFSGLSNKRDGTYGYDVTYTLSEPMHARDWFPVKQVLEDKIDSVTFNIICDSDLLAGSNGLLVETIEDGSKHILIWKTAYPMAYYLISFAVADYRDYSFYAPLSLESDTVLVQNYIYDTDQVLTDWEEEILETGDMITYFSTLLIDYPFSEEKYGHTMAPLGGGMEHQTMTTIQNFNFFLVAHELAHQWFGDYITCGNWQDIWINEGFASYMEYLAAQGLRSQADADNWMDNAMSVALSEREGSVYVPEDEVENEYRLFSYALSYKKGAVLLHMIRFILDDDPLFFQVFKAYLFHYQNGLATGADFQAILEEESGMDFSAFFKQWYYGEGFPQFKLFWYQKGDSLYIYSEQSGSSLRVTPLFQVPFELELRFSDGQAQRNRLTQQSNGDDFTIPVEGVVEHIVFDPENQLLKTASVVQTTMVPNGPGEKPYRYGPNPVSEKIHIQFPNITQIDRVRITSYAGQEIFIQSNTENPLTIDLSALAEGPYLLELTINSQTFHERIVKVSVK